MKYTIKMMEGLCEVSHKKQHRLTVVLNSKKDFICGRVVSLKVSTKC